MFRFIHTSDWQIGKAFGGFPEDTRGILREARIDVVRVIGRLATERQIRHVMVSGDIFDIEEPSDLTLMRPQEAMRSFDQISWHLIPGNHDSAGTQGIWDRMVARGLPANVHLHLEPAVFSLENGVTLLPCPLPRRRSVGDLTAWTEGVARADGELRIGMGHGPVTGFAGEGEMVDNLIPPDRPERSDLDYLALGDWHRLRKISPRLYYSGTPETDRFKAIDGEVRCGGGSVLEVSIAGPRALPAVEERIVGRYNWYDLQSRILAGTDLAGLRDMLASIDNPGSSLCRLKVDGVLSLSEMTQFEDEIVSRLGASFVHFDVDKAGLLPQPNDEDLEMIDKGGFVRAASEKLRVIAADGDDLRARRARRALVRLFLEARDAQSANRGARS